MPVREIRWLGFGLLASAAAGVLGLTSTMTAAPALAVTSDASAGFGGGGFYGGSGDTALVMGPSGFPVPPPSYVDAANDLYLNLPAGPPSL